MWKLIWSWLTALKWLWEVCIWLGIWKQEVIWIEGTQCEWCRDDWCHCGSAHGMLFKNFPSSLVPITSIRSTWSCSKISSNWWGWAATAPPSFIEESLINDIGAMAWQEGHWTSPTQNVTSEVISTHYRITSDPQFKILCQSRISWQVGLVWKNCVNWFVWNCAWCTVILYGGGMRWGGWAMGRCDHIIYYMSTASRGQYTSVGQGGWRGMGMNDTDICANWLVVGGSL